MNKTFALVTLALATFLVSFISPAWAGSMSWSGQVDDNVNIVIRGRNVQYQQITGNGISNTSYRFDGNLTPNFHNARLNNAFGRGSVNIIHQQYGQVVVRIEDPQPGAGFYKFTLRWDDNPGNSGGGVANPGIVVGDGNGGGGGWSGGNWGGGNSGGNGGSDTLRWQAPVDGIEDIRINGNSVTWNKVRGVGAWGVHFNLSGRLPARAVNVKVNVTKGRGSVYVLQQPTYSNNFTCTIRVVDNDPGAGNYDFTVIW